MNKVLFTRGLMTFAFGCAVINPWFMTLGVFLMSFSNGVLDEI